MEIIKVVLIGESGVGKTSIIQRYVNDVYDPNQLLSSSAQFITKTVELNDEQSIKFDVWDTAGQEKFRALAKIFYKDAKAIVLVYDITNRSSFEQLQNYWFKEIEENSLSDAILVIVGNKSDLYEEEKVTDEEAKEYAYNNNIHCFITSARNNVGINNMFEELGNLYLEPTFKEKRNQEMKERNEDNGKKNNIVIIQKDLKNNDNTEENNKNKEISNQKKKINCC